MASASSNAVQTYVKGLRAKSDDEKAKTAHELHKYVRSELREMPAHEMQAFLDEFNHQIYNLTSSADNNDKKGAILAIVCLASVNVGKTMSAHVSGYVYKLRTMLPCADIGVIQLTAKAMARVATSPEHVKFEVERALEWLGGERDEARYQSGVIMLREMAYSLPTYFYQLVGRFFGVIFRAVRHPKPCVRVNAVSAIRAALLVTSQREAKEANRSQWYQQCFDELMRGFAAEDASAPRGLSREDRVHGSLMVLDELLRCSNLEWELEQRKLESTPILLHKSLQRRYGGGVSGGGAGRPRKGRYKSMLMRLSQKPHFSPGSLLVQSSAPSITASTPAPPSDDQWPVGTSLACRTLLLEQYTVVCDHVVSHMSSKSAHVQQTMLSVLPRLAALDQSKFCSQYMSRVLLHILTTLQRKDAARSSLFFCLGLLTAAVRERIVDYVPKIIGVIKQNIVVKDGSLKRRPGGAGSVIGGASGALQADPTVYLCSWLLAQAGQSRLHTEIDELMDHMLAAGLNSALPFALQEIAAHIPELRRKAGDGLMTLLATQLGVRPPALRHRQLNTPPGPPPSDRASLVNVILAMRTLSQYQYDNRSLMLFIQYCADQYLTSEDGVVRVEAVRTTCHLLTSALLAITGRSSTLQTAVSDVIGKLLSVGITDTDCDIRLTVFWSLEERFDNHLAQAENLDALFVALNDEVFEIRELVLCTIGRLSAMNPAYVMPSLRKTLIQLLVELEHSGLARNKEQAARLLGHLIASAPRLTQPYLTPIVTMLAQKLDDTEKSVPVVSNVLYALGDLANVCGPDMAGWVNRLFPLLLAVLSDGVSLTKREAALYALANLIGVGSEEGAAAASDVAASSAPVYQSQFAPSRLQKRCIYRRNPQLLQMLLGFLRTEQRQSVRRETIRVLGLLGALDPYLYRTIRQDEDEECLVLADPEISDSILDVSGNVRMVNMSHNTMDDFYPAVAIGTLMGIIRDPALSQCHSVVVQAMLFIIEYLGTKSVAYLPQLVPCLLLVIRTADPPFREFLFQKLASLINVVRQHIRPSLPDIFAVIKEFWLIDSPLQPTLINLVEQIAVAMGSEFRVFMPQLIPNTLRVLYHDTSQGRQVTVKLLDALCKVGRNLDDYLHLLVPALVRLFDPRDAPVAVCKSVLNAVTELTTHVDLTDYMGLIVHKLIWVLDSCPALRTPAMDTLCGLMTQMRSKYALFIPAVGKVLVKHGISCAQYDQLIASTVLACDLDEPSPRVTFQPRFTQPEISDPTPPIKISVVTHHDLQQALRASSRISKDDWSEWLRRLSITVLKESPSRPLRSCYAVAQACPQLVRDLFNAAFVSCWTELDKKHQAELLDSVRLALKSQDIPEITQTLLNLTEFMAHCDLESLPIESRLLGERALNCRAYAKALHYMEDEFHRGATSDVIETLISINNKLQQYEAAQGLLEYARKHHTRDVAVRERWQERLHNWQAALDSYQAQLWTANSSSGSCADDSQLPQQQQEVRLGQMRCLEALGQWDELAEVAADVWPRANDDMRLQMSRMAAAASVSAGPDGGTVRWQSMLEYVQVIPRQAFDGAFYRAIAAIKQEHFDDAAEWIDAARDLLDTDLTSMIGESYQRAYGTLVSAQILSELEEVIDYKLMKERRPSIMQTWRERLQGCTASVEDWQRILHVRSLVISPRDDIQTRLNFAALCRKHGRLEQCRKVISELMTWDCHGAPQFDNPHVQYAYIKYIWSAGEKANAVRQLERFVCDASGPGRGGLDGIGTLAPAAAAGGLHQLPEDSSGGLPQLRAAGSLSQLNQPTTVLLSRCFLKLADWKQMIDPISELSIPMALQYYQCSTKYDPSWYRAWHSWAFMNYQAVLFYKERSNASAAAAGGTAAAAAGDQQPELCEHHMPFVVPAVQGFVRSISLSPDSSLQDTLRLLTLWFQYGQAAEVNDALVNALGVIKIDNWLQVIPQLIARIDTPRPLIARLISSLLCDVGKAHPQALVYPLTVAKKSSVPARERAAMKVLKNMMEHSEELVQQAILVSDELIRVAILWDNRWYEGLEEASRLYFGERNIPAMFAILEPLHAMMERGPETLKERSFSQAYGQDLSDAQELCRRYKRTGNARDLNLAWNRYYQVFRRISRQLPLITTLELPYVSPQLMKAHDLQLAIPGSYVPHRPVIRINSVKSTLTVFGTKQRPRKVTMRGSDGRDYTFLVKGHEDLRQDERVMQLFGLVNTLLRTSAETMRRNLSIQRFAVVPLSTNSGLIGWVPHSDTLHTLIRDHREKKKIMLNIEHKIMLRMAPDYEHLTLMQKVEVFEHALETTKGDDLAKLLWLRSPSSEIWFERRANFTRSLAVMSMVGYILGLGDRHPSNLMLDRLSGKILHIDFGDCFEVAMTREKFPEKIPFRLTRMLVNAMEVTGIEGTYRMTCESVMSVLRNNRDSVMAVLEAFVYDPLLNWRIMDTPRQVRRVTPSGSSSGVGAASSGGAAAGVATDSAGHNPLDAVVGVGLSAGSSPLRSRHNSDVEGQLRHAGDSDAIPPEAQNRKAVVIIRRVRDKLTGADFGGDSQLNVGDQVERLVQQATSNQNLCQCYIGWCSFW